MLHSTTRRDLLRMSAMAPFAGTLGGVAATEARAVESMQPGLQALLGSRSWSGTNNSPRRSRRISNFLGNQIASHLVQARRAFRPISQARRSRARTAILVA